MPAPHLPPVSIIAHADWSKNPVKRWMAMAVRQADQRWQTLDLLRIDQPAQLFTYLRSQAITPGFILAGFDVPIGLPAQFAQKAHITDFMATLPLFGQAEWAEFYQPAESPEQISLHRPFYPARPGGAKRNHLERGFGIPFSQLYRLCEGAHGDRRAACPIFWTMGGQQVGKAAISGWEELLSPALCDPSLRVKIWPFSGAMSTLCQPDAIVVVETYPAEVYGHLGLSFSTPTRRSKRHQADRAVFSTQLIRWTQKLQLDLTPSVFAAIEDGFGNKADGEDQFDALVGLYGMINIMLGNHGIGEPSSPELSKIEGWIFGMEQAKVGMPW